MSPKPVKQLVLRETALFLVLLLLGLVAVPIAIYVVGQQLLGEFAGYGYADFFGTLSAKIRAGDAIAWFLVLAPYLGWQILRLTLYGWRYASRPAA